MLLSDRAELAGGRIEGYCLHFHLAVARRHGSGIARGFVGRRRAIESVKKVRANLAGSNRNFSLAVAADERSIQNQRCVVEPN